MRTSEGAGGKGILNSDRTAGQFSLARYMPSPDLDWLIKRFWVVRWDLRGKPPYRQIVLSHPNVNMVFECGNTRIYGVNRTSETRIVQGEGRVLGIKFQPGGFYPFWKQDIAGLAGKSVSLEEAFGQEANALETAVLAQPDDEGMIRLAEQFFRARMPERDEGVEEASRIVRTIENDRHIAKVDDLADRFSIGKRTLQRLFSRYVGISPKWVIQRYRLHEAAEQAERGEQPDWVKLSMDMGYYDQAHFIKDFKAIIGKTPEEHRLQKVPHGLGDD
ncbi:DUF6597 domain-containing transcriptional factor [Paenibacillus hodogayensis]|uniref:DUF6597 domain-containing transcriptional factor n=1 Tax=Paenibacillus hodogayensis TaxID=279208 RepID=A0ABV5VZ39_9BACL